MNTTTESTLEHYDNSIQTLRTEINILDEKIVGLLLNRLALVHQVREFKQIDGVPQHTPQREQVVINNVTSQFSGLEKEYVEAVYTALLDATRIVADKKQVLL